MCLALPMKIVKVSGDFAHVESGRLLRRVNIAMLKSVKPGDYVLVHTGFAIEKLDPQKAKETLKFLTDSTA